MKENGMRKPNRRALQDESGRKKQPMPKHGESLKHILPRHINPQLYRSRGKKRS